jgi:3-phenylpropionate/trans-cinnamate dioxygenase ferredoxin reductase subunit
VPWFWSDQFDMRLQIAGIPAGAVQTIVRGDPADGKFAVFHLNTDGRVLCVEAVSFPQAMAVGKMMIGKRLHVPVERLGDESVPLKELVR